ncbi:MAG: DNA polymerase III subunit delta [Bacteroidota bacterium]|nr:DNA polymerase III subunit delta [Candidatus Kapabacteria bacterium]MDW8219817.1 DNA polymerase III subunit delta [Bacteroidota bacterium]
MLESIVPLVQAQTFPPILLLFGEEEFLVEEAVQILVDAAIERNGMESLNYSSFDGGDITPEDFVAMASAFPMMSERRVVVVKHFEKMTIKRGKNVEQTSPLTAYFRHPSPFTFVILTAYTDELYGLKAAMTHPKQQEKAKKKLAALRFPYNILIQECEWIEFPKLHERALPSWVAERFAAAGYQITPEACELLIAQTGYSLRDIHNEMQKVITFVPHQRRLTKEDIAEVLGGAKMYNIFELQRAIAARDLPTALLIMRRMITVERQELIIIAMLTRYFTILWKLSEALQQTHHTAELGKAVGIDQYFINEYIAALRHYPTHKVEQALYALRDADSAVKSSMEGSDIILQKMLVQIIGE